MLDGVQNDEMGLYGLGISCMGSGLVVWVGNSSLGSELVVWGRE